MNDDLITLDKLYSNENNILLEIVNEIQKIVNNNSYEANIKALKEIIIKLNNIINENKKRIEST